MQYVADNINHNTRTLDGNNNFHGMGMITTVTPGTKQARHVPRRTVKPGKISLSGKVQIQPLTQPRLQHLDLKYKDIVIEEVFDPTTNLGIMWKCSLLFGVTRSSWSGMMQTVHKGEHKGQSSIFFLLMINMNPCDVTCIFSALKYVCNHARHHNVVNPITYQSHFDDLLDNLDPDKNVPVHCSSSYMAHDDIHATFKSKQDLYP